MFLILRERKKAPQKTKKKVFKKKKLYIHTLFLIVKLWGGGLPKIFSLALSKKSVGFLMLYYFNAY